MIEKLDKNIILKSLSSDVKIDEIIILNTATSTNDILSETSKIHTGKNILLLSEEQTAGKGQFGRHWHSPAHQNIYLSLALHFKKPRILLQDLSIKVGKILIEALRSININNLTLKHPNDILYNQKKLAGILIETFESNNNTTTAIIGVGCNIHLTDDKNEISQPWTSLDLITNSVNNRNDITALFVNHLVKNLTYK